MPDLALTVSLEVSCNNKAVASSLSLTSHESCQG